MSYPINDSLTGRLGLFIQFSSIYTSPVIIYSRMNKDATPIPVLDSNIVSFLIPQGRPKPNHLPGTHANNTHLLICLNHLGQEGGNLPGTGGTNRVSKGNGTSLGVDLGHIQSQFANAVDGLTGEGLVQLENVDITLLDTGVFVQVLNGENRSNAHLIWAASRNLCACETGNWL